MVNFTEPLRVAMVLFPSFTALDAFGPLNALNILSAQHPMTLALVAADLAPQSVDRNIVDGVWYPSPLAPNSASPFFTEFVLPTHTFAGTAAGAGSQFDVIFVPGGGGTRNESATQPAVDWLAARLAGGADGAPVRFVMSDCTGAALLARTGRLAGRRATTNKAAFRWVRDEVPGAAAMTWVPRARWVVDGNLWTSSGVSAGTDMMLGWIEHVYGRAESERIRIGMEWNALGRDDDPFAELYGLA